jgi:SAM-dependent methyltransferase
VKFSLEFGISSKKWKNIPDNKFDKISDHSHGYFIFEDSLSSQTLKEIYRVLVPGGILNFDLPLREEHVAALREVGFIVENNIATKT